VRHQCAVRRSGEARDDLAGGSGGLFKSLDRGGSWAPVAAFQVAAGVPLPGLPPPAAPLPSAGPAAIRSLLIDPTNPGTLYAGTRRTNGCFYTDKNFYKSTDGGVTWKASVLSQKYIE